MAVLDLQLVKIAADSETEIPLSCPEDYIIDELNQEIILKQDLDDDERLVARNYTVDFDQYRYLNKVRHIINDRERTDRAFQNESIIAYTEAAISWLNELVDFDIYIDKCGTIRKNSDDKVPGDKVLNIVAIAASLKVREADLIESMDNAIKIREGETSLDTTSNLGVKLKALEKQKEDFQQRLANLAISDLIDSSSDSLVIGDAITDYMYNYVIDYRF